MKHFIVLYSTRPPPNLLLVVHVSRLLTGKYMQMMNILKPIAFDVIHCVSQLFDYYLYAVYTFFGRNDMVQYFCVVLSCCGTSLLSKSILSLLVSLFIV